MTLLVFFLIISLLVIIHELGHFTVAKRNGIEVEEFGFGIPPRIWGKKFGETLYSINWLPFGGFVKLKGEDAVEDVASQKKDSRSFMSKTPGQRFRVLSAGVFMNFILAILLWSIFFLITGFKSFYIPLPFDYEFPYGNQDNIGTVVANVMEGSGANRADITTGMAIRRIGDVRVNNAAEVRDALLDKLGTPVEVELLDLTKQDANATSQVLVTPQPDENGRPVLGVLLTGATVISYDTPLQRLLSGPMHAANVVAYTGFALGELIGLSVEMGTSEPVSSNVAGPVGIYSVVDAILASSSSKTILLSLIDYTALMSISLAVINLLPIPALDGGRLVFVVIENIFKKPINPKYEAAAHQFGMLLLLGLLVLVTIKDISQIF